MLKSSQKLNQKSKKGKHYYWIVVPQMYLASALILAKEICPDKKFRFGTTIGSLCKDHGFQSSHPNYEFIWPIVFNLKHGIELWLKGLGNMDHGRYADIHDLKTLFSQLIANSGQNKKVIEKLHKDIWPVVEKYYYGTYNPRQKDKRHPDKLNTVERFPEQLKKRKHGGGAYKLQEPYEWVDCNVIDSIAGDIRKIESSFAEAERNIKPQKRFNY